ncbi:MAG: glycoside hydrolase family 15 protein [Nitrospirota bacterium]
MYKKISEYGIIGDLHSVALVAPDGSIDWMCLPYIDSGSIFGALLDDQKGGRFRVRPAAEEWDSSVRYLPGTNILETDFRTREGVARMVDFMPVVLEGEAREVRHELLRRIDCAEGTIAMEVLFDPRFDYARAETVLAMGPRGGIVARGGGEKLGLAASRHLELGEDGRGRARWGLKRGDRVWLNLRYGAEDLCMCDPEEAEEAFRRTEEYWHRWLAKSETGRAVDLGPYGEMVERSALVLKLLYYAPTGTVAAAATTSLPEEIGGVRNWDYRFTWVRDTSFTLEALFNFGHMSETEGYLRWVETLLRETGPEGLRVLYGLRGETDITEEELGHLEGYRGSRPVRVGNAAGGQRQLDIYGELMDAALKLSDYVGRVGLGMWPFLKGICDYVTEHWRESDNGIWEVRDGPYHYVYSKVMCWVALDRGVTMARRYGFPADLEKWLRVQEEIKEEVLEKGWSRKKQAFLQHYGGKALDASALLIPLMGFLPHDDPRVASTLEAVRAELAVEHLLYRYVGEDGLPGEEGQFLYCTFWLVDNLTAMGRYEEAEALLDSMEDMANHLGLFSEEYDYHWQDALGNFPQALTHIGYINSVVALRSARAAEEEKRRREESPPGIGVELAETIVLNEGETDITGTPGELATMLKERMNVLRGAFFEAASGRVAYERMEASKAYREYVELSHALRGIDPRGLDGHAESLAFWINIYNVLVIHGVVETGVRDSVKEVRDFFRRVQYEMGGVYFSPDDIEHGVLRGNARPPYSLLKPFGGDDPRLACVLKRREPRVHFALVCASSSCPPIGVYTPEAIEEDLDVAARTFLNAGGVEVDRTAGRVRISRIFKWYGKDFGPTLPERLRFVGRYLYREEDREFLLNEAENIGVTYQDYDWRLNRY